MIIPDGLTAILYTGDGQTGGSLALHGPASVDLSAYPAFYDNCASLEVIETPPFIVKGYWKQLVTFNRQSLISTTSTFALDDVVFRGISADPAADKDDLRDNYFRPTLDDYGFTFLQSDGSSTSVSATDAEAQGWNAYAAVTEGASSGHYCQISATEAAVYTWVWEGVSIDGTQTITIEDYEYVCRQGANASTEPACWARNCADAECTTCVL